MPTYKKKRRNRFLSAPKKSSKVQKSKKVFDEEIKMSSKTSGKNANSDNMHVVTGKKLEGRRKFKGFVSFAAIVLVIFLIFEMILPAGVIQTLSNLTAVIGTGSYPISIPGSETINTVPVNNYYFCLTDTHLNAFSNSGKQLFSEVHGFEKPVLKVSGGRALLYDQGGVQSLIFDLNGVKTTVDTEKDIIAGDISDSGYYSLVTYSDKYASVVNVYNKNNSIIYEWYSAEDIVNNICLSSNGKKMVISTFNSKDGIFTSKVNVINYKTATPEFSKEYNGTLIYGINRSNKTYFNVINSNGIEHIKWSNHKITNYSNNYPIAIYRKCNGVNVGVFCRNSDKTDNQISIFLKNGKVKYTLKYKGIINDIQVKGGNIYLINDTEIVVMDFEGKVLRTADYGYGGTGVTVISANTVVVIFDDEIKKVKIQEGE